MEFIVVTSLLGKVEQELLHPSFILPHHTQIILSTLKDKLCFLQAYLDQPVLEMCDRRAAERRRICKEIRAVAIAAEDRVEFKVGEVYLAANKGECAVKAACIDLHQTLQKVVKDIKSVEVHIRQRLQTSRSSRVDGSPSTPWVKQLENNLVRDNGDENMVIGVEDDVEKIKDMLLIHPPSTKLQVVSIVGRGGSGKTTLARRVYEDPSIMSHFDIRAWTVESGRLTWRKILVDILGCIVSSSLRSQISNKDEHQLAEQLRKSLMGQRYLIIIDEAWSSEVWDAISRIIPDNSNGSRVLITTQDEALAEYAGSGTCIYQTHFLGLEERWNLLTKIVSNGKSRRLSPEYELIGRRIVEKCSGIPLLIALIGGLLLSTLNNSPKQWEDIERELNYLSIDVCYNYLPSHLKASFFYLAIFPTNTEIHVKKLIKLWMAEGFFKSEMNKSLEEIGEDYLCDLINRRLVQVHKRNFYGKIKSCMLHDTLHDFCFDKADKEHIFACGTEDDDNDYFIKASRWINCYDWPISPSSKVDRSSIKTRSLLNFGENLYATNCSFIKFSYLKLLRVLDLSLIRYWHGMPSEIVDLIHLRYLALTTIGSLCNFQLFKLQNLQTLILSSWAKECQLLLPHDVLDLPWLRHVCFDKGSSSYLPNLGQENLQTLSWFKVNGRNSRTTNFTKVPNLKELGIYIEGEVLPNTLDSLAQLHQLEKLKLEVGRVEHFNLLNSFPSNLKQLTLNNTYLSWEEMDIIGKLPNLNLLKLKNFAFCGPAWKPTVGGFLQLKFFLIDRSDLEHWYANLDHFPVLEHLILRYCWDLEKLPNGFEEVYTLRLIELGNCCSSLVTSAKEIQQRQRDFGYEALVVRDVTKVELPTNESSEKQESAI